MRWIFKYNEQAKKYLERLLKTKIAVEPQPWLHVAVKTMSNRNPWCGYAIYVWDTREIQKGGEYRSRTAKFTKDMFTIAKSGMSRALDDREPLKGGRKDVNEFFEFGEFDASKSEVFDGKERVKETKLYKKYKAKAGNESYEIVATEVKQTLYRCWLSDKAKKALCLAKYDNVKPSDFKPFSLFSLRKTNNGINIFGHARGINVNLDLHDGVYLSSYANNVLKNFIEVAIQFYKLKQEDFNVDSEIGNELK